MKILGLLLFSALMVFGVAGAALAHVEVSPEEVPGGASATFTVSVPNELDTPTTEVRVEVPEGFDVESVGELSGWQVAEKEESGRVAQISWSGGEIAVEGSEEFTFEAIAPSDAGEYLFGAIQTYDDGTVVEWVGPEDSSEPASIVTVRAGSDGTESHEEPGHSHESETNLASLPDSGGAGYAASGAGLAMMLLGLSIIRRRA